MLIGCPATVGTKHCRVHRMKKKKSTHHQQKRSLQSLVKQVQEVEKLDKDDTVDEKAGVYKFTVCLLFLQLG